MVCRNACPAPASPGGAEPRALSWASGRARRPRPGPAGRRVPAPPPRAVGSGAPPDPAEQLPDPRAEPEPAPTRDQGQDDARPWERGGGEKGVPPAADAAARDEHEPLRE